MSLRLNCVTKHYTLNASIELVSKKQLYDYCGFKLNIGNVAANMVVDSRAKCPRLLITRDYTL